MNKWWDEAVADWTEYKEKHYREQADYLKVLMKSIFNLDVKPKCGVLKIFFMGEYIYVAAVGTGIIFFASPFQSGDRAYAEVSDPIVDKISAGMELDWRKRWTFDELTGDILDQFLYAYPSFAVEFGM